MQVKKLFNSDSQLVINQVNGNFTVRDKSTVAFLKLVMDLLLALEKLELTQIPHSKNAYTHALSKLANSKDFVLLAIVPIEHLSKPSTTKVEEVI